jgi:hypothetical protein
VAEITVAEIIDALTELVNGCQPLSVNRPVYENALRLLSRIDELGGQGIDRAAGVALADVWKIVPAAPTRAMIAAWWESSDCSPNRWRFVDSYRAMMAAAPSLPMIGCNHD